MLQLVEALHVAYMEEAIASRERRVSSDWTDKLEPISDTADNTIAAGRSNSEAFACSWHLVMMHNGISSGQSAILACQKLAMTWTVESDAVVPGLDNKETLRIPFKGELVHVLISSSIVDLASYQTKEGALACIIQGNHFSWYKIVSTIVRKFCHILFTSGIAGVNSM